MSERFAIEYNSARGFVIVDTTRDAELCVSGKDMAERVCESLNVAVARGLLRTIREGSSARVPRGGVL